MTTKKRDFRSQESLAAEESTRAALIPFLTGRGYEVVNNRCHKTGTAIEQFVSVRSPEGQDMRMRVRLCWRRAGRSKSEHKFSAAQLRKDLIDGDWDRTLQYIVERDRERGNTHHLIAQRDRGVFLHAALIPLEELLGIWKRQHDVSKALIELGKMGRIRKNHARNGTSPTIWLQDDRTADAHEVADVLWKWPGVIDIATFGLAGDTFLDSLDDCPRVDPALLGSDGAARRPVVRSEVERDPRVRTTVINRSTGCERQGCGEGKRFPGFLDVHHILGAEHGDRVWNCVALCPNCHREAHYSPDADALNEQLLTYASRFREQ